MGLWSPDPAKSGAWAPSVPRDLLPVTHLGMKMNGNETQEPLSYRALLFIEAIRSSGG